MERCVFFTCSKTNSKSILSSKAEDVPLTTGYDLRISFCVLGVENKSKQGRVAIISVYSSSVYS